MHIPPSSLLEVADKLSEEAGKGDGHAARSGAIAAALDRLRQQIDAARRGLDGQDRSELSRSLSAIRDANADLQKASR